MAQHLQKLAHTPDAILTQTRHHQETRLARALAESGSPHRLAGDINGDRKANKYDPCMTGPLSMHKVLLDTLNTIESFEWRHRAHTVRLDQFPTAYEVGDRVEVSKYVVFDAMERSIGDVPTLSDAKELIDQQYLARS